MTDSEDGKPTVPVVDEVEVTRVEHVVTEPVRPRGGSTDEDKEDE